MQHFIHKDTGKITGTVACFDRILFKGYLPTSWPEAMDMFMSNQGLLLKEFKEFVTIDCERLQQHAKTMAEKSGRPYIPPFTIT